MKDKTELIISKIENLINYTTENKETLNQHYHVIKDMLLELKFEVKDVDRWMKWFDEAKEI